jgi:hypothetical protein
VTEVFREARGLADGYRDELAASREFHCDEIERARRRGRLAWGLLAAALLIICGGIWFAAGQDGDHQTQAVKLRYVSRELAKTEEMLEENSSRTNRLIARIETLTAERDRLVGEMRSLRLGQADAVGQLTAYRTYSAQLSRKIVHLEAKLRAESTDRHRLIQEERQRVLREERQRYARLERERAIKAERSRAKLISRTRSERERIARRQDQRVRARQDAQVKAEQPRPLAPQQRQQSLARIQQNNMPYRSDPANMTLTELENALTRKFR